MYEILKKTVWSDKEPRITEFVLNAPEIARAHRAGQFVIIILGENGERIPLTIADKDVAKARFTVHRELIPPKEFRAVGVEEIGAG